MPLYRAETEGAFAALHVLAGGAVLVIWEGDEAEPAAVPQAAGQKLAAPLLALSLPTSWGGTRKLQVFRQPAEHSEIVFVSAEGQTIAHLPDNPRPLRLTAEALFGGLAPAMQVRALRFVLQSCRSAFGLGGYASFARLCRDLVNHIAPNLSALTAEVDVTASLVLCEGPLSAKFGRVSEVIVIDDKTVRRNAFLPADGAMRLALDIEGLEKQACVVLFGDNALACRGIDLDLPRPRLLRWLDRVKPGHELREYLAACLARKASEDPTAEAGLREMQLLFPMAKAGVTSPTKPLGGEVELAVSHDAGGLFVSGWLHDPHGLIESITAISATGRRIPLNGPLHRFPRPDVARHYGETETGLAGFATFAPLTGPLAQSYQHRFELALRSGDVLHLAAPLQPGSAVEARDAVLGAMPSSHLSQAALAEAVAPPAARLHGRHMAGQGAPEVISFGVQPANPTVSIVVPLYKVLDFLRFQIAAFAVDYAMAGVELIYVLDSPEQRLQAEHLLRGLHALYGLPFKLVVMSANFGFAAASNSGAALARSGMVLFLNSDVIPDKPGWLPCLVAGLESNERVGAVGPKLLFDDDSLQHAGMYFDRDLAGDWYNLHYHKGLPRAYAPAVKARLVPAVTGACLLMRTSLIERLGGFCEDFIIGDYEDSDLCLRLRAAGQQIGYVPEAELYHLERQSISHHDGYGRGAACAYNRGLHAERWDALMEELCGTAKARRKAAA